MPRNSVPAVAAACTAVLLMLTLAGCDTGSPAAGPQEPVATQVEGTAAAPTTEQDVAAEPTPTQTLVANEFSQVVDGVLYQGTERAPVRIGTDIPGQPPAPPLIAV
ncbi:hypothetical protein [Actinotalea solisilvae]|uniref:hypothetical protein n=1 Tax=Actinotalea solisilvae TaxID=2072922 RepID=UPI0018F24EEB|nr:hypothetical protein [Actinotalea solisilvae]